jgi:GT2 family glycosyltransferase
MPEHFTSVVIPSFNGLKLLEQNLPAVEKLLSAGDELIVVDDASSDESVSFLKQRYSLKNSEELADEYGQFLLFQGRLKNNVLVKVIKNDLNLRFAASCNRAVKQAKSHLVLLLNNDVEPGSNLLETLKPHFSNKKVFAVGCMETEPNQANARGGKNRLWFDKGLFQHARADQFTPGKTAWASGGSAIFDRKKWLELDGFDTDYYPAYWEDIDLSYRAQQKGWQVLFEPKAKVIHNHESTHRTIFSRTRLENLSWKHAHCFVWKNGTFKQKLQNLFFRPYWCWQRLKQSVSKPYFWILAAVILIAAVLRLIYLGQVPHGMTWDEAAIGYNGYAVIQTRRDEWLQFLPISFRSFGDYKAPLAIYLNGIFTTIFGLNLWAVRLPFALAGVLAVVGMIKLTGEILEVSQYKSKLPLEILSLGAGLVLAFSPWHLHFSRTGFESGLALSFTIWGLWFAWKYFKKVHVVSFKLQLKLLLPAMLLLSAAVYTYHSAKIFVPLLGVWLVIVFWQKVKHRLKSLVIGLAVVGLCSLPLMYDSFYGEGLTRSGSLIFSKSKILLDVVFLIAERIAAHISPQFLVMGWTDTLRHGPGAWGVLLPVTFILVLIAALALLKKKIQGQSINLWPRFAFFVLIIGLLPAILGQAMPQANRALLALPGFIWLALYGLEQLLAVIKLKPQLITSTLLAAHLLTFGLYLNHYYTDFAAKSVEDFRDGYIEAFEIAHQYETGSNGKPEVEQIIFSNAYNQAYIYALFVRKTNPIWYQGGSLIKYLFVDEVGAGHLETKNRLVVATKHDPLPAEQADHLVYGSDGNIRFKIYYTGDEAEAR